MGLVGVGVWHAGVGMMKVVTWLRGPRRALKIGEEGEQKRVVPTKRRKLGLRGLIAGLLGIVGVGLLRKHGEGKGVSSVMVRRYEAIYARLPWYKFLGYSMI